MLIVVGGLGVGGTEVHLSRVLPHLQSNGFLVTVFSMTGPGIVGERLAKNGVDVMWAPGWSALAKLPRPLRRVLGLPVVATALLCHMWRLHAEIVHFFLPEAYLVGAICSFFAPCGRRVMSRRSLNSYQVGHPLLTRIERWLHGKMDLILANSSVVATQLIEEGVAESNLRIIENGFDPPVPDIAPEVARDILISSFGLSADHFVMVNVANLIPYKGHRDLLAALSTIRTTLAQPWVLFCVGRDDGILEELQRMCRTLSIEENVVFCGSRSDVWTFQRGADLAVFSSLQEGSPNAVLESMCAAQPFVSTNAGGVIDLIQGDQSRFIVQVADVDGLAHSILELAQDVRLRQHVGEQNQRRAVAKFSLQACVSAYERTYLRVVVG
ncbi:MAG: glycosyltransferase [Verrucomicrobia bacterium]|nr:glycosyltransferase [Verrucomicrobiota bacterium]